MSVFIGEFISNIVALYIFFLYLPHPCKSLVFLTAIHAGFSACDSRFQQLVVVVVVLLLELPLHKILESRNASLRILEFISRWPWTQRADRVTCSGLTGRDL